MFKLLSVYILFFIINNAFATTIECHLVGGIPSTYMATKFSFTKTSDTSASFNIATTKGNLSFENVACKDESTPDAIFSCEHDDFVMILATDEKPLKAVINPIVYAGKEYGPFFYFCK